MEELGDYFALGKEILCYRSDEELAEIVSYYLAHDKEREEIRRAGYRRFLREHTYIKRWQKVLLDIKDRAACQQNSRARRAGDQAAGPSPCGWERI